MDNRELQRLVCEAQRDPALTPLHAEILRDRDGKFSGSLHQSLTAMANALDRSIADGSAAPALRVQHRYLQVATLAAADVLAKAWQTTHKSALSSVTANARSFASEGGAGMSAEESSEQLKRLLAHLSDIAVIAALMGDERSGERIRRGLSVILPNYDGHELAYVLGLVGNQRFDLAERILLDRRRRGVRDDEQTTLAEGLLQLARGDQAWRGTLQQVLTRSAHHETRTAAEFWISFVDSNAEMTA